MSQSLQHCIANMHYADFAVASAIELESRIPNSQLNSSQPMSISDPRVLSWSILNISNNSWPIWPRDMKEKTRLWSHDLFTISPQQHLLKHNMCTCIVSMRLTRYIIDSSLRVRACIRIITNTTTLHMKYCLLSWLFIRTIETRDRARATAQKVHVHLRVRLHCEFCVFCFVTVKSALFARYYHIFGMLFIPKTIIIFNFYLVIFGVLYVVKLKLALEIFACPIRAIIYFVFFVGVPKCLPDSNFYLPRAIGQALMSHPGPRYG